MATASLVLARIDFGRGGMLPEARTEVGSDERAYVCKLT